MQSEKKIHILFKPRGGKKKGKNHVIGEENLKNQDYTGKEENTYWWLNSLCSLKQPLT